MTFRLKKLALVTSAAAICMLTTTGTAGADVRPQGSARGATIVTLNQATIGAVIGLGLTPAPVTPGVLGTDGDELQASFPIVASLKGGVIKHVGGLSLSTDDTVLRLTNYAIDTNTGRLWASASVDGASAGRLPLFDLGVAPGSSGCAATASLALSPEAAAALTAVFGAPNLSGADFGDACVAPRT